MNIIRLNYSYKVKKEISIFNRAKIIMKKKKKKNLINDLLFLYNIYNQYLLYLELKSAYKYFILIYIK